MKIKDLLAHPFSVPLPTGERVFISDKHKKRIIIATIIAGIFSVGLAAPFIFFGLSQKYRILLKKDLSNKDRRTSMLAQDHLNPKPLVRTPSQLLSLSVNQKLENRSLCKREGMTCFLNATLQTIAHLPDLLNLFTPNHILKKLPQETDESFENRRTVQFLGNQLLSKILTGNERADGLKKFLEAIYITSPNGPKVETMLKEGGDAEDMIRKICAILLPQEQTKEYPYHLPMSFSDIVLSKQTNELNPSIKANFFRNLQFNNPNIIRFRHYPDGVTVPPLEIQTPRGVYRLETLITSGGHSTAFLRKDQQHFVEFDDLQNHPVINTIQEFQEKCASCVWSAAFYHYMK